MLKISDAVRSGETDFEISASGQHDIGGPLWHPEGKILKFHVTNAGQRVGSMCLPNTEIIVEGSTSADVGWLNAGGIITVKGDAGDCRALFEWRKNLYRRSRGNSHRFADETRSALRRT